MALKTRKQTLADKINSLVTTTPATFNSDDEAEDTTAKVVDHYEESDDSDDHFQASEIRRRNIDLLDQVDKRYKGKKVSRKDVYESDNNDSDPENPSESDEEMESMEEQSDGDMNVSDNEQDLEDDGRIPDNDSDDDLEEDEGSENSSEQEAEESDVEDKNETSVTKRENNIQTMSQMNVRADIEKGNCVQSQLKLWEHLLEVRIKLQKCLTASNQMPQHDIYEDMKIDKEFVKTTDETKSKLKLLLNNMLQLQTLLLKQYPETKSLTNKRKRKAEEDGDEEEENVDDPMDEEIPSDTEDEDEVKDCVSDNDTENVDENICRKKLKLSNYEKILSDNHNSYVEYRNSVVQKWNEKTKIATGKLNKGTSETALKQIEFALNDKEKLRRRSRLKRSEYKIIGKPEQADDNEGRRIQEYDSEIYDDDDFYHQLLRDLIEYKSSDVTDPIQLSKQWIQLQNMRSKMKRKIDTRATKGRRIRYNVHNKLVNFMAPITVDDTWTDHAKDELYNSLFGKIKPTNRDVGR
ncbi:protein AATF-like [Ceratina calcarata]|uniref:Protein AATF-like n=1 Tax=Ceratina calcarata TaxID=156304 RepID=A0AAJ7S869_9HYME|nr:protein AATF-like [Ceratina calcarata]